MTRSRRLPAPFALVVVLAFLMSACSVSTHDEPRAAGPPFEEFLQPTTTTSTTTPANDRKVEPVYFLRTVGGTLRPVAVQREYEIGDGILAILRDLVMRPPDTEGSERPSEEGLTSDIPSDAVFEDAEFTSPGSSELVIEAQGLGSGTQLRNALAQIVCTATEASAAESVSFRDNGEEMSPIVGGGESVQRAVTCEDYQRLG